MAKAKIRLVVTGGRDYSDKQRVVRVLLSLVRKLGSPTLLLVINGGAPGLDSLVEEVCLEHGIPCATMKAPWPKHKRAAGIIRNQWMIDYLEPTHGVVFPGRRGTADMASRMEKADLKIKRIKTR